MLCRDFSQLYYLYYRLESSIVKMTRAARQHRYYASRPWCSSLVFEMKMRFFFSQLGGSSSWKV